MVRNRLILKGGIVLQPEFSRGCWRVHHGDLVIEHGYIAEVANLRGTAGDEVMDVHNCVVMPAFCNAHTHGFEYALKGFKAGRGIDGGHPDWFWTIYNRYPEELSIASARLHYAENLAAGVGCVGDVLRSTLEPFRFATQLASIGLRGMIFGSTGTPGRDLGSERQADLLKRMREAGASPDVTTLHMHYLETQGRRNIPIERYGRNTHDLLRDHDLFGRRWLLTHCGAASEHDFLGFRSDRTLVAVTPWAEVRLGDPSVNCSMLDRLSFDIALGSDGPCYHPRVDMFAEMRCLAARWGSHGRPPDAGLLLHMATLTARPFLAQEAGSFGPGSPADLAIIDIGRLSCQPLVLEPYNNLLENLVWGASSDNVIGTVVEGRLLYWRGRWRSLDVLHERRQLEPALRDLLREVTVHAPAL